MVQAAEAITATTHGIDDDDSTAAATTIEDDAGSATMTKMAQAAAVDDHNVLRGWVGSATATQMAAALMGNNAEATATATEQEAVATVRRQKRRW
jgi:hypothetical protein